MKVIRPATGVADPAVTVLLASHMKPYLRDAISSVLAQTRTDVHVLVVDSGQWVNRDDDTSRQMAKVFDDFADDPRIEWADTQEGPDLKRERCPIGWSTNETIRAGLIRGKYVATFYDDDVYYPEFIEKMAGYLDANPDAGAVMCTQDRMRLDADGTEHLVGIIHGSPRSPGMLDCQVDGAQVMFRREMLDVIGDPWLPEDPGDSCRHSDGLFLEKLAQACGNVHAIPDVLLKHRFTPISTYTPSPA